MLLGNIAMAAYCLQALFSVPASGPLAAVLTTRRAGPNWLGLALAAAGVAILFLA